MNDIRSLKYSKELSTSIEDDARRRAIDAAKKRAVAQNVDYPTFAALVSVAHLKPFQRQEAIEPPQRTSRSSTTVAWHFDASGNLEKLKDNSSENLRRLGRKTAVLTCDTFRREWKLSGSDFVERLTFLLSIRPQDLPLIFKVEVPPFILAEIVETLSTWKSVQSSDGEDMHPLPPICQAFRYELALEMLYYLTKCGRFSLSLKLIGPKAHNMLDKLLNQAITESLPGLCFKESHMNISVLFHHLHASYGLNN